MPWKCCHRADEQDELAKPPQQCGADTSLNGIFLTPCDGDSGDSANLLVTTTQQGYSKWIGTGFSAHCRSHLPQS